MALGHLRRQLASGEIWPGRPLVIQEVAAELRLSPTPVREAMARLAGEGLIEARQGGGYRLWRADALDLADLYEAHLCALLSSLRILLSEPRRRPAVAEIEPHAEAPSDVAETAFDAVMRACGNLVLVRWRRHLAQRLAWARRAEAFVFDDVEAEAQQLARDLAPDLEPADQARAVANFHRRRRDGADLIARALRDLELQRKY